MRILRGVVPALLALATGLEAAADGGLDAIRERGYVRVCADPSNLPFSSSDPSTPGFEVELARLVARQIGVEARFEWTLTYVRALRPLRDGACDLFMGLPQDDRFREANPWIAVSRPYYTMGHAILARSDAGIQTLSDLAGKRVAIEGMSPADSFVFYRGLDRGIYRSQEEAFRAVAAGEVPAALLWLPVASWLARGRADLRVIPIAEPRLEFPIGAGVRRRDRDLAAAVDDAVGRLKDSGKVREVLGRYGAVPSPGPRGERWVIRVEAKDAVEAGRSLFSTACSRCHGAEGVGGGVGGLVPVLRNYEGGQEKFLRITQNGRPGTAMAPFKGILTAEEILSIYRYLTSFSPQ
ncbi:MAG: transporter substrate-binding domain-containing protein [Candidatus Rokubacteria bacterium]|nr:transporter substrate-binding domain-containing protein [Candidatus Rokubacteria bacterium]